MSEPSRLSELQPGQEAIVTRFHAEPHQIQRLREMGLITGTRLRFLRSAPLGDPIEIQFRGYRLSLRKQDASQIEVTPSPIS